MVHFAFFSLEKSFAETVFAEWTPYVLMTDPTPLHRPSEIEDLTHLTEEDKSRNFKRA